MQVQNECCTTATHDINLSKASADVSKELCVCVCVCVCCCLCVLVCERGLHNDLKELWEVTRFDGSCDSNE